VRSPELSHAYHERPYRPLDLGCERDPGPCLLRKGTRSRDSPDGIRTRGLLGLRRP